MAGTTEGGKKTAEGGRGDPEKASPSAIANYIRGAHFPANKEALVKCAEGNNAPKDVMYVINHLPEREYESPPEIMKALKEKSSSQSSSQQSGQQKQAKGRYEEE